MAVRLICGSVLVRSSLTLRPCLASKSNVFIHSSLTPSRWQAICGTSAAFHTKASHLLPSPNYQCLQQQRWLSKPPTVKPPGKIGMSLLRPYMKIMERMEKWMEKKYPKAHNIYMLFKVGIRDFFVDVKTFYTVAIGLRNDRPLRDFSHVELNVYGQLPWDMLRVAPVLIISALPFMNYVIFPIAYFFPRQLLCRHFWTPQQRLDFGHYYLSHRVQHYPKILLYLEKHTKDIKDNSAKENFRNLLTKVRKGQALSAQEIVSCKPHFEKGPFSLDSLGTIHKLHMWHISKSLNLSTIQSKLASDILLLHYIDMAIEKAGVSSLTMEQLQQTCFARGMEAKDVSRSDLEKYLKDWVHVSSNVNENSLSLLLHCPVFLAYNHSAVRSHFSKDKRLPP